MRKDFTAGPDDHDRRLESVLRRLLPHQSLGTLQKALRRGDVRLNGAKAAPEARVASGDTLSVWDALIAAPALPPEKSTPRLPPRWILHEGEDLLAVNKPSGILVHRGDGPVPPGAATPLDDLVRAHLLPSSRPTLSFRPGPLHRLDRETSGIVVFSKTLAGARSFSRALADRKAVKLYLAVLAGTLSQPREVTDALARDEGSRTTEVSDQGQAARTVFRPLVSAAGLTLAEVTLGTGRTHQIRVHARSLGLPLAGDAKYGGGPRPSGLPVPWVLHAWKLSCPGLPDLEAPFSDETALWLKKTFKILP